MPKPKDVDFCQLVVLTVLHDGLTPPQAARLLHCDPKTVRSTVSRYLVGEPLALQGRKGVKHSNRKCSAAVQAELLKLLKQDECLYLDELAAELQARTGTCISVPGVCRALQEMEWTRKKLDTKAREADQELRASYAMHMYSHYRFDQFIFEDETAWEVSGQDARQSATRVSYAEQLLLCPRSEIHCNCRHLMQVLLNLYIRSDAASAADMEAYAEEDLVPLLHPFPGPHSVVVCDNCRIHASDRFRELIESRGARLLFLPAYSPDLNPIEKVWSQVKAYLRRYHHDLIAKGTTPAEALQIAFDSVTPADCVAYMKSCGSLYMRGQQA